LTIWTVTHSLHGGVIDEKGRAHPLRCYSLLVPSAHQPERRNTISTFKLLGAAAILSTALATPVLAQAVISEPGYCAFFYPNANCQNKGPGNPYTDSNYQRAQNGGTWSSGETVGVVTKRPRAHRSDSSATRTQ
jgi:hypothetical protein